MQLYQALENYIQIIIPKFNKVNNLLKTYKYVYLNLIQFYPEL